MRFSTVLLAAATWCGVANASPMTTRQEAARFGLVSVEPSSVKPSDVRAPTKIFPAVHANTLPQTFTVSYNSTRALAVPKYLDIYVQGTLPSGFVLPYYQILRYDWPQDSKFYQFETQVSVLAENGFLLLYIVLHSTQLPVLYTSPTNGYEADANYLIWAFITYPNNDPARALVVGGTSTSVHVDLS